MKLSELRTRFIDYHSGDPRRFMDMENAEEYGDDALIVRKISLEKHLNATRLGAGCFATVYDIGNNLVLKVCKNLDKGYDAYIRACKENRDNPHLPRVYYIGNWAGRTIYILEKLTSLNEAAGDLTSFVVQFVRRGTQGIPVEMSPMLNPASFNEKLVAACHMVKEISDSDYDYGLDIHCGNIMMHRDGRIIITDPLTYRGES